MFVSLQNSYVAFLTPKDDGIRRWGLCEVLKSWGWRPQEGDWCSCKGGSRDSPSPSAIWGHSEKSVTQKRALIQPHWYPISYFQHSELWKMNFCCLQANQCVVFCCSSLKRWRQPLLTAKHFDKEISVFVTLRTICKLQHHPSSCLYPSGLGVLPLGTQGQPAGGGSQKKRSQQPLR